jgi:hypothetical protein
MVTRTAAAAGTHHTPAKGLTVRHTVALAAAILAAGVIAAAVWLTPRPVGDLYVALAAGRDIAQGKLAQGDDWALSTGGRVWINQNWLSHLAIYLVHQAAGDNALLALKGALMAWLLVALALSAAGRGLRRPSALIVAAGTLLAARSFIDLRPNLFALAMMATVLWLLLTAMRAARARHALAAIAAALVVLWGNVHGSFLLGLGMLWLWALCEAVPWLRRQSVPLRRRAAPLAWPLAATIGCGVLNPFGWMNLTHVAAVAGSAAWRGVPEWQPIYRASPFGTVWELLVVAAVLAGLWGVRLVALARASARMGRAAATPPADRRAPVFETTLVLVAFAMAVQSRRFIPLALVAACPVLAGQLAWLLRSMPPKARRAAPAALAAGLLLAAGALARQNLSAISPENPASAGGTLFERMHKVNDEFPVGLGTFVKASGIGGNVICDWRWEGYLRWRCPQLRFLMGGRAQQIYTERELLGFLRIIDPATSAASAMADLEANHVRLALVPAGPTYAALLRSLVDSGRWAIIYDDGRHLALAEARSPVLQAAAEGRLVYPDADTAALSRAMLLASPLSRAPAATVMDALEAALERRAAVSAYMVMLNLQDPAIEVRRRAFLERQAPLLAAWPLTGSGALEAAKCSQAVHMALADIYQKANMRPQHDLAAAKARQAQERLRQMMERWDIAPTGT